MPSPACQVVQDELMFLGDIFCIGIVKKGLEKVGSLPDSASPKECARALDAHIEPAIVSFVGPVKARKVVLRIKERLARMEAS